MSKTFFDPSFAGASEYAEMYRSFGWQVVPAKHPKEAPQWKRPALPEWRELENTLAPDLTFQRWYGPTGDHINRDNMGIITGRCSNLVVVDLDIQKHPEAHLWWCTMREMQKTAGEITTVCQKTGGGGVQHFFRIPEGWTAPTCKTSIGVDIRGQGGFAMCPPSLHESGERYEWLSDQEPWAHDVITMPQWLCNEIDKLAQQYGGRVGSIGPNAKTSSPDHSLTAFGQIQDGREDYMTRFVWGRMVDLYREAPMMEEYMMVKLCEEAFVIYERQVKSRLPMQLDKTNADLLEQEGRGVSMFRQKWAHAYKQWHGKVKEHAAQEPPAKDINRPLDLSGVEFDPETGEILGEYPNPDLSIDDEFAATPKAEQPNKYKLIPANQLKDEPVQWLITDILPVKALGSLYGKPGTYKSFVATYAGTNISLGLPIFGKETVQGDVVYIAGEGGAGLKRRMDANRKRHNLPEVERLFFLKGQLNMRSKVDDVAGLIKEIKTNQIKPVLIIIDTLARAFAGGNENSSEDMGAFIAMVDLLQQATDSAVLLVHHSGKDEARGQRGHSSLLGAVDTELELLKMPEDDSLHRIGQLTIKKQKDGEDGLKFLFHMELIALSDIDPENASLALVPIDKNTLPQKGFRMKLSLSEINAVELLKKVYATETKIVLDENIPKNAEVMSIPLWYRYFSDTDNYKDNNSARAAFNRIKKALKNKNIINLYENYCWFTENYMPLKQT